MLITGNSVNSYQGCPGGNLQYRSIADLAPFSSSYFYNEASKQVYGETPTSVNVYYTQPKTTDRRGMKKKRTKRAVITLADGKTVDLTQIKK